MIEFIIYDEDRNYQEITKKVIEKVLMQYDYTYKISIYKTYDSCISALENNFGFKVYILDINSRIESGLSIATEIRNKKLDWQSMIIFTSNTNSYKLTILEHQLMTLDYILKNSDYEVLLESSCMKALKNYDYRPNTLKYSYKNTCYNIPLSEIIYIEKEQDSKRCIIKTVKSTFYILGNLRQLEQKLDKRFIKCNRSYLINIENVECYNTKDNIMTFVNQDTLNIISRTKRKEIISYLRLLP